MNKIIRTFSLIFSILFFSLITNETVFAQDPNVDSVYVITEKYTVEYRQRTQAREDIAKGLTLIYRGGIFGVAKNADSLAYKYGFKLRQSSCVPAEGNEYYNDEVVKYLNKRNGEGWWEQYLFEESKLEKIEIPPLPKKKNN